jgi:Family of unknown function (DUF5309)
VPVLTRYETTAGAREDVLDVISQLSPEETPFLSRLGVGNAIAAVHSWLTDTLISATACGSQVGEGATAVSISLSGRTRLTNYTQISAYTIDISGTQEATTMYGTENEYSYQLDRGMKTWKIWVDRTLWTSTSASGSGSGTVRAMTGAIDAIQTNRTTGSAASCALTENVFNSLLQSVAETGGGIANTAYARGFNKRRISSFATNNTRYSEVGEEGRVRNFVSVYESDFGTIEVVFERYITPNEVAVLNMDSWRLSYLRRPFVKPLSDIGDSRRAMIVGEYTLEYLAESHNGLLSAFASA